MATDSFVPSRNSTSKKWLWVFSGLALGIYCWFHNGLAPPSSAVAGASSLDERLATLERNQSVLNARLDRALAMLASGKRGARPSQERIEEVSAADTSPPTSMQRERQMVEQAKYYEQLFVRDSTDLIWASNMETAAMAVIGSSDITRLSKPLSQDVDCRGAICRLSLIFENGMAANEWESYFPLHLGQALPALRSLTLPLPDGRVELRFYGFRGGEDALNRAAANFSS